MELPSFSVYDFVGELRRQDEFRANFTVTDVLDTNVLGQNGANITFVDQVGRRMLLTLAADFHRLK